MIDIKHYLMESSYNLRDDKELLRAWADVKVNFSSSQEEFAKAVGISSRTLRNKISNDNAFFNQCLEEFAQVSTDSDLSEDILSSFVDNVIKLGTNPKSSKDLVLFAELFSVTPDQVKRIMQIKGFSFRGWLQETNLDFINEKKMFKDLLSIDVLYSQNKQTVGATERALDIDLNSPLDQYRLMYMGAIFMSLYNQYSYTDLLNQLSLVMKLEQIKNERDLPVSEHEYKQMSGTFEQKKPMTRQEVEKYVADIMLELEWDLKDDTKEIYIDSLVNPRPVPKPTLPDKETIKKDKEKYMPDDDFNQWLNRMANKLDEEMY
ncbi:hypothetical protein P4606_26130 [Priestia aryabhattai]|uniref:hypothetical protein n=1 Tax=Priestia aryabhattai TaxID=412384 RepID=UPI002E224CB6|nr:hypothetical protein [Priestia aryabhattai]